MKKQIIYDLIWFVFLLFILFILLVDIHVRLARPTEPPPAPQSQQVVETTTATTPTTTTEPPPAPHYPMTDEERDLVERVVMAEAGGESYEGQMAVAQCILNASRLKGARPPDIIVGLKYARTRPEPSESVRAAVSAVFDDGVTVFDDEVIYFYAPALCRSDWHETQEYVATIGCHRFFKEAR